MLQQLIEKHLSDLDVSRLKWLWLAVLAIVLDFTTKQMAEHFLQYAQPVYVLPIFDLTLLYNKGAAFSFLANESGWQRWFFCTHCHWSEYGSDNLADEAQAF